MKQRLKNLYLEFHILLVDLDHKERPLNSSFFRESAAIYVCKYLMDEGANIRIYDPKVTEKKVFR